MDNLSWRDLLGIGIGGIGFRKEKFSCTNPDVLGQMLAIMTTPHLMEIQIYGASTQVAIVMMRMLAITTTGMVGQVPTVTILPVLAQTQMPAITRTPMVRRALNVITPLAIATTYMLAITPMAMGKMVKCAIFLPVIATTQMPAIMTL